MRAASSSGRHASPSAAGPEKRAALWPSTRRDVIAVGRMHKRNALTCLILADSVEDPPQQSWRKNDNRALNDARETALIRLSPAQTLHVFVEQFGSAVGQFAGARLQAWASWERKSLMTGIEAGCTVPAWQCCTSLRGAHRSWFVVDGGHHLHHLARLSAWSSCRLDRIPLQHG